MSKKSWRIILLCLLLLALLSLSACQLAKDLQNATHELSQLPQRFVEGFINNILEGIKGIGSALADSVGNIVRGMRGH
jgi:hypothetical protein